MRMRPSQWSLHCSLDSRTPGVERNVARWAPMANKKIVVF